VKEILVDTNVLVSFLTDRNQEQQEKASVLFEGAADRRHRIVLHRPTTNAGQSGMVG
jgi:predicted nucleic acid-binding protein